MDNIYYSLEGRCLIVNGVRTPYLQACYEYGKEYVDGKKLVATRLYSLEFRDRDLNKIEFVKYNGNQPLTLTTEESDQCQKNTQAKDKLLGLYRSIKLWLRGRKSPA